MRNLNLNTYDTLNRHGRRGELAWAKKKPMRDRKNIMERVQDVGRSQRIDAMFRRGQEAHKRAELRKKLSKQHVA